MNGFSYSTTNCQSSLEKREYTKIAFQYLLMLVASGVAGWFLPRFWGEASWQRAAESISRHFHQPFVALSGVQEMLPMVFRFFLPILCCIGAVTLFSFSSLSCLVTDGVLVYLGMRTGCTASILFSLLRGTMSLPYSPGYLRFFLFILFKLLLLHGFFLFAMRMARASYHLRRYSREGRPLFHPKTVSTLIVQTCLWSILLFILHGLYGFSIYVLSK